MKITKAHVLFGVHILFKITEALFVGFVYCFRVVFSGLTPKKTAYEGTFHTPGDLLSRFNKGFNLTGTYKATVHDSCLHTLVIGGSGTGKSSTVLFPTLYNMKDASLVIHDPSGELFQSSGYLKKQGYEIKVLHYANLTISVGFNPIQRAVSSSDMQKISAMLVRASLGDGGKDPFWSTQAASFIALLIAIVKTQEPEYQNFANVKYLLENYQIDPDFLDRIVAKTGNEEIIREYKVFLKYESKVMANIVSTCRSAISIFNNPEIQKVTSIDTIDFSEFRTKKIALFIQNKTSDMKYYGVLTSMFAEQFFGYIMNQPPNNKKERKIYFLLDEASSLYLPHTLQIALSNLRKFSCGLMLLIQDYNQLIHLYGKHEAEAIKTNCYTKIYFPNQDIDTCKELETFLGKREYDDKDGKKKVRPVLTADEIKTMPKGTALIFCGSHRAIYARMKPYYKQLRYWLYSRIPQPFIERKLPEGIVPLIALPPIPKKATPKSITNEKG